QRYLPGDVPDRVAALIAIDRGVGQLANPHAVHDDDDGSGKGSHLRSVTAVFATKTRNHETNPSSSFSCFRDFEAKPKGGRLILRLTLALFNEARGGRDGLRRITGAVEPV